MLPLRRHACMLGCLQRLSKIAAGFGVLLCHTKHVEVVFVPGPDYVIVCLQVGSSCLQFFISLILSFVPSIPHTNSYFFPYAVKQCLGLPRAPMTISGRQPLISCVQLLLCTVLLWSIVKKILQGSFAGCIIYSSVCNMLWHLYLDWRFHEYAMTPTWAALSWSVNCIIKYSLWIAFELAHWTCVNICFDGQILTQAKPACKHSCTLTLKSKSSQQSSCNTAKTRAIADTHANFGKGWQPS